MSNLWLGFLSPRKSSAAHELQSESPGKSPFVLFVMLGQAFRSDQVWPNSGGGRFHDRKLSIIMTQSSHDLEVRYRHVATVYILSYLVYGDFIQFEPERVRINVFSAGRNRFHNWPTVSSPTGQEHRYHELKKLAERGTVEAIAVMQFGSITIDEMK